MVDRNEYNRECYRLNINGQRDRLREFAHFQKIRTDELKALPPEELLKEVGYYELR